MKQLNDLSIQNKHVVAQAKVLLEIIYLIKNVNIKVFQECYWNPYVCLFKRPQPYLRKSTAAAASLFTFKAQFVK